ncbi:hypothetical protein Tco_0983967 [Tanacetum coccineum]
MMTMPCSIGIGGQEQNLIILLKTLNCFHLASGLKINIAKSQVLGVGVSQNVVLQAANGSGVAVVGTLFSLSWCDGWGGSSSTCLLILRIERFVGSLGNVLASKLNGGLGVSSFFALNRALLLKWVWRFISGDGSLWCKVIQAIYGSKFDLSSWIPPIQSSIWDSLFALELDRRLWLANKWELFGLSFIFVWGRALEL